MIKGEPTSGLCYDPNDPRYWDPHGLEQELERVFELCHLCRLCFNLCPSFPALFDAVDRHNGDVRALAPAEVQWVVDTCYQCKICYLKCPYTPDEGHSFQLDFPRLMLRARALKVKERGLSLRARLLSRPELIGRIAGLTAPLANWANRRPWLRIGLERLLGIHRSKLLPEFHWESFERWLRKQPPPAGDPNRAVLFITCAVNFNAPEVGQDCLEVYSRHGIALSCPPHRCCGMPALEAGDVELARRLARANVEALAPHVRQGKKVVVLEPTCSYMLRKEYPELVGTAEAREVAAATRDACEFLFELKQQGQFNRQFRTTPGRIAYHLPCHLRAQNIGYRSRDLMRLIPGASVKLIEQCSGHDGTWAMKKEFFPLAMLAGNKAFEETRAAEAEVLASDCLLAAVQFQQAIGRRAIHPIQVLARAYRTEGFPTAIQGSGA